jgi:hypothetical protein
MSDDVNWSLARCADMDPEFFFMPETEELARSTCMMCPIRHECLQHAIDNKIEFGVWGGMSDKDRRNIKFRRHRVKCPNCNSVMVDQTRKGIEVCAACALSWMV